MSLLNLLLFLPLLGAGVVFAVGSLNKRDSLIKGLALGISLLPLLVNLYMLTRYDWQLPSGEYQFGGSVSWIASFGITYTVGLDGLSMPLVFLTALLTPLVVLLSFDEHKDLRTYFTLLLLLECGLFGVFAALDFFLFYLFWELVLIPMYFLILGWGGPRRRYAAIKFFVYTHVASLIMLVGIFAIVFANARQAGFFTFDFTQIGQLPVGLQYLVFPALFFGFAVKIPIVPFHTWLPDAHVEAPTAASVLLAGVLLKMGGYGLIRIAYMLHPAAAMEYTWLVVALALLSIVYGSYAAFTQDDLKKLIAYSSISHMGFVLLGIASFDEAAVLGAVFQMVAHGLISAMLFMGCGVIQHSAGTRRISLLSGLYSRMPVAMTMLILAFFASMGIPGFMGFFAEFSVMLGVFRSFGLLVLPVALGAVLAVGYYLWAFQRVAFGQLPPSLAEVKDIHWFELAPMLVLLALTIYFGLQPDVLVDYMRGSVLMLTGLLA